MSNFLAHIGFKVDTCFDNIQEKTSCGFNAANIIAYLNGLLQLGLSWRKKKVDHLIYSSTDSDVNICHLGNTFLGCPNLKLPRFLKESQCLDLVKHYDEYFDYSPKVNNKRVYNLGQGQSNSTFKRLIESQLKSMSKRDEIPADTFYIVNTDDSIGKHWYVIGVSYNKDNIYRENNVCKQTFKPVTKEGPLSTPSSKSATLGTSKSLLSGASCLPTIVRTSPPSTPRATRSYLTPTSSNIESSVLSSSSNSRVSCGNNPETTSSAGSSKSKYFTPPSTPTSTPKLLHTKATRRNLNSAKQPQQSELTPRRNICDMPKQKFTPSTAAKTSSDNGDIFIFTENEKIVTPANEVDQDAICGSAKKLKDAVLNTWASKKYIPPCFCALGIIFTKYGHVSKSADLPTGSKILDSLPAFFGPFKDDKILGKNIKRNIVNIVTFMKHDNELMNFCLDKSNNPETTLMHNLTKLTNASCPICCCRCC